MSESAFAKRRHVISTSKRGDSLVKQTSAIEIVSAKSRWTPLDDISAVKKDDQSTNKFMQDQKIWHGRSTTERHRDASTEDAESRNSHQYQLTGSPPLSGDVTKDGQNPRHNHLANGRKTSNISLAGLEHLSAVVSANGCLRDTSDSLELTLMEGDTVTLLGQYEIWVRRGSVTLLGAVLQASTQLHRVHAPSTHSLPVIQCPRFPGSPKAGIAELTIFSCFTGIRQLGKYNRRFNGIWGNTCPPSLKSYQAVESMIQRMEKSPLAFDTYSDWLAVANKIKKRNTARLPVILVCGAKGSGKSTLTRYLCNHFQSHQYRHCGIGLLDLDPGQPEYSPPAEISLIHLQSFNLGTPFSHPVVGGRSGQIVRRHYLGTFNPRDETSHYIESSQDLFQHYKRTIGRNGSPLIVNSCGWIQGSGLDTLLALVRHLQPTDIILLETEGISDVLHSLETVSWQTGASLQTCDSRVVNPRSARSPSDLREMQIYSYFHLAKQEEGPTRWASKPAHLQDELQLSYSEPEQTIVGILLLGEEINFDMLEDAIVGTVLALVAVEDTSLLIYGNDHGSGLVNQEDTQVERVADFTMGSLFDLTGHTDRTQNQIVLEDGSAQYIVNRNRQGIPYLSTKDGINRPLDPSKTCSLGQVLIQGVDRKSKRLTVVTPISTETIEKYKNMKNPLLLVRGRASMAGWSYLEEHCDTLAAPKNTERLERDTEAQQQLDNDRSGCESDHYFNLTKGTQKRHWVEFTTADGGTRRNKVWRVRRNLAT